MIRTVLALIAMFMFAASSCQKAPEKNKPLHINISQEPTCFDPRKVFDPVRGENYLRVL